MRRTLALFAALLAVAAFSPANAAESQSLSVGDPAPKFEVQDDEGKTWKSSEHFGKKLVVIYFYPADMTGGCTAQACAFRDNMGELADKDVEVVGVSGDSVENHQLFKKAHGLNFTLLADTEGKVADAFGVPKTVGEKTVKAVIDGISHDLTRNVTTQRWTFIVDREGKIAYKDPSVNARQDSQKVLAALADLR
jgi:Peroxiredoxin